MSAQIIQFVPRPNYNREPMTDLTQLAADIIHQVTIPYEPPSSHDTAPCEMSCAGEQEPA